MRGQREEQRLARPIVLSLRPRFAEAILTGEKSVELRRTRVAAAPGAMFILYASGPVKAVVGTAKLVSSDTDTPDAIWSRYGSDASITRAEFDEYFAGAVTATALTVAQPKRLPSPATLNELRTETGFRPPQSYRYLADDDPQVLHNVVA